MEHTNMMQGRPKVAIIDSNTLAALGLKNILQNVMPIMTVDTFGTFSELEANMPDTYVHYFVSMSIAIEHLSFFTERLRRHRPLHGSRPRIRRRRRGLFCSDKQSRGHWPL